MVYKNEKNTSELYDVKVYNAILKVAPLSALGACVTFTVAYLFGYFQTTSLPALIIFDCVFFVYVGVVIYFNRQNPWKDGRFDADLLNRLQIMLVVLVVLQWNLISYIFPTRTFWGFAPLFILLTSFFFTRWSVIASSVGIMTSIVISWIINGDKLLPARVIGYEEDVILSIVCLVLTVAVINILSRHSASFKNHARVRADQLVRKNAEFHDLSQEIIEFTANLIEQRDETSGTHVKRVQEYVKILSRTVMDKYPEYGLDSDMVELISLASSLHDIGKLKISDTILLKPGKLTPEEFDVMKKHSVYGSSMVDLLPDKIDADFRKYSREICMYHHERYDGHGYPVGLRGEEIPVSAQIVAIVDCYDALTSKRPYKEPYTSEKAAEMIENGECGAFSAHMLECFRLSVQTPEWKEIH